MTTNGTPTIRATITKSIHERDGHDGYTVMVTFKENGVTQAMVEKVVATYYEAETIAQAFATRHSVLWHKVELVSN